MKKVDVRSPIYTIVRDNECAGGSAIVELLVKNTKTQIRNFRKVTPLLYRGGQPQLDQIQGLKEYGITTVVCLRYSPVTIARERRAVEAAGMKFISIPMFYWRVPSNEEIEQFMDLMEDESATPIFVHCYHGADRTGLLVGMYRIARQGWSFDAAYAEMKKCGFHRFTLRHFKWILWHYAKRHKQAKSS